MEKAILLTVDFKHRPGAWEPAEISREMAALASSCGLRTVEERFAQVRAPNPGTLIGAGKLKDLKESVARLKPDVVVLSADLTGSQQRNLEEEAGVKTIDRTQLILDIFARRARSQEGKLQVELAQLNYLLPRLAGKGILLSRLGGGIGTRGPGEQKLEMDRRRIRERILRLKRDLARISGRRESVRAKRHEGGLPAVSLVGYTNAGKSTLFNAFTKAGVAVEDRLFSTLDPTARPFVLPNRQKVVFVDTVGFLHLLPHHLVEAFRATLEETAQADLLLHVIDASNPRAREIRRSVEEVLSQIGASDNETLIVLNKTDRLEPARLEGLRREWPGAALVSARTGEGLDGLAARIQECFSAGRETYRFRFPPDASDLVARVYRDGKVIRREDGPEGILLEAVLPPAAGRALRKVLGARAPHAGDSTP